MTVDPFHRPRGPELRESPELAGDLLHHFHLLHNALGAFLDGLELHQGLDIRFDVSDVRPHHLALRVRLVLSARLASRFTVRRWLSLT
eukprot:CAMPEP_0177732276 /NCGR_PEP_ID=MMETSP0484_2-20121128/23020_1 /TAXON_ID=354590 /ORGANISM="Rhodomonas lens, Strain RHODO" /LENGTH=87 /DNA_ID=CAMNT_0019245489 /DNA_START=259 /DNA_END=519 /DNA_ORIENTATION=-